MSLRSHSSIAEWCVVGAGPCGILACGVLVDIIATRRPALSDSDAAGRILWLDEQGFRSVGRFERYRHVPGNTPVSVRANHMAHLG